MNNEGTTQARRAVLEELVALRRSLLDVDPPGLAPAAPGTESASRTNFLHYLKLRQSDLRPLQARLSRLGLSSLSHSEKSVLASVTAVTEALSDLCGTPLDAVAPPCTEQQAQQLAAARTAALLGELPPGHTSRIMVTLPTRAGTDEQWVRDCVRGGMAIARINCAHDAAPLWELMINNVRRAAAAEGVTVLIHMDLGGPKLRTDAPTEAAPVLRLKPARNEYGAVTTPARILLCAETRSARTAPQEYTLGVEPLWLSTLAPGSRVVFRDLRGRRRTLSWVQQTATGVLMSCEKTAYVGESTLLKRRGARQAGVPQRTSVRGLPRPSRLLKLGCGDEFWLAPQGWQPAGETDEARSMRPVVGCTLPEAILRLEPGHAVWLDDGRIGASVVEKAAGGALLRVNHPPAGTVPLATDKGINLPDTDLELPFLSDRDKLDFEFIKAHADSVGLSFVQKPTDLDELEVEWKRGPNRLRGVVLKIETRRAFAALPELLLRSIDGFATGVMIARGDLAVECGWERLAEVQEEILWLCEAAHVPVIWATAVLDRLAKTGQATRAEITDAAMAERAECIMLNKGPFIPEAIHMLADIASRMHRHQSKKHSQLNDLKVSRLPSVPSPGHKKPARDPQG